LPRSGGSAILIPAVGHLKVRALHLGHFKSCLADKRAAGYSKDMLRLIRATLSVILGDVVEEGLLPLNPVAQLARRRRGQSTAVSVDRQRTIRPLSAAQVALVLETAAKVERELSPYLLTLARAGLRPSEGLALQWDDLAFKGRELRVERSLDAAGRIVTTKTGRARVVDMSVGLAVALQGMRAEWSAEALKRGSGKLPAWVFCSEAGTALGLYSATKGWRRILKRAKLPGIRLYDLRHYPACRIIPFSSTIGPGAGHRALVNAG
jgi:integrase